MDTLQHALERARLLREQRDYAKDVLRAKKLTFAATISDEEAAAKRLDDRVSGAENDARIMALAVYDNDTDNRKPAPGIEIKLSTERTYDPKEAFAWAKEHRVCLSPEALDVPAFEAMAKVMILPFVKITQIPKAQLATNIPAQELPVLATAVSVEAPF